VSSLICHADSFGRFWDMPVPESNMATTPKACTS